MYLKFMLNLIILSMANYVMAQSLNVFGQPLCTLYVVTNLKQDFTEMVFVIRVLMM